MSAEKLLSWPVKFYENLKQRVEIRLFLEEGKDIPKWASFRPPTLVRE
jgi:hypothetical protein